VKDTHLFFFLPSSVKKITAHDDKLVDEETWTTTSMTPLDANLMSENMKNFIPGVGVEWRYKMIDEKARERHQWVLMYKGIDDENAGIIPGTLDTNWKESVQILDKRNEAASLGGSKYEIMTNAEVIMGTYSYFLKTGKVMFQETFTRVQEQTNVPEDYQKVCNGQKSHLFIGRFNNVRNE